MTDNNNWEEVLDDVFAIRVDEKVDGKTYKDQDYGDFFGQRDELKEFIRGLLSKKDQEHRAELEGIKSEIEKQKEIIEERLYDFDGYPGSGKQADVVIKITTSIIDSRIEKTVANA